MLPSRKQVNRPQVGLGPWETRIGRHRARRKCTALGVEDPQGSLLAKAAMVAADLLGSVCPSQVPLVKQSFCLSFSQ